MRTIALIAALFAAPAVAQETGQLQPLAFRQIDVATIPCEVFLVFLNDKGFMRPEFELYFHGLETGLAAGHPRLMTEFRVACSADRRMPLPDALAAAQAAITMN